MPTEYFQGNANMPLEYFQENTNMQMNYSYGHISMAPSMDSIEKSAKYSRKKGAHHMSISWSIYILKPITQDLLVHYLYIVCLFISGIKCVIFLDS